MLLTIAYREFFVFNEGQESKLVRGLVATAGYCSYGIVPGKRPSPCKHPPNQQ